MRIVFVDVYNEYGDPSRGINHIGVEGFVGGLVSLGHEVLPFYYDDYLVPFAKRKGDQGLYRFNCVRDWPGLQSALIEKVKRESPHLVLFNLYTGYFSFETLEYLKKITTTANFFGDDPFLFDTFTKHYCHHFSHCFTTDVFSLAGYRNAGVQAVSRSQWGVVANHSKLQRQPYLYDVSFVGARNPERAWFVDELQRRGVDVKVFGNGWGTKRLSEVEMVEVFLRTKINLNLSNNGTDDLRFLLSSFRPASKVLKALTKALITEILRLFGRAPKQAVRKSSQIKGRNFEISFHGGFQLSEYVPGIEDYFIVGKEIACYKNVDEAALLVRYYLENETDRETIRLAGYTRATVSGYTYTDICRKMLVNLEPLTR